jgi:hypothetical protein
MHAHAAAESQRGGPAVRGDAKLSPKAPGHRGGRVAERGEQAVPLGLHDHPADRGEGITDQLMVRSEGRWVTRWVGPERAGRPLDVDEAERYKTGRELAHRQSQCSP